MLKSFKEQRILIVDDVKFSRDIVLHILRQNGMTELLEASNGDEALEICHRMKPDLIIADLLMPGMDGYELCRRLRNNAAFAETPIIVQTSVEDANKRAHAFNAGASDLIVKPINPHELLMRTRLHIHRHKLMMELRHYRETTSREMQSAKVMQFSLLPTTEEQQAIMTSLPVAMSIFFEPSYLLSGDMLGAQRLVNDKLAFYLVDFAGHGILASLNTFRLHTLMHTQLPLTDDPGEYLTALNASLFPLLKIHEYATMFYGVVDIAKNELRYASAASPRPMIFTGGKLHPSIIDSSGIPLGVVRDTRYQTRAIQFHEGDVFFGFSDALIEARKNPTQVLDEKALHELCYEYMLYGSKDIATNPKGFQDWILEMYQAYSLTTHYLDDMTLFLVSRLPRSS